MQNKLSHGIYTQLREMLYSSSNTNYLIFVPSNMHAIEITNLICDIMYINPILEEHYVIEKLALQKFKKCVSTYELLEKFSNDSLETLERSNYVFIFIEHIE